MMNFFITKWKKWNLTIKVGYVALIISFLFLFLALILIGTAQFTPEDADELVTNDYSGNGFKLLNQHGVSVFFKTSSLNLMRDFFKSSEFESAPLVQMIIGCVFLVILLPISTIICVLALVSGYFMRWLYT